MIRPKLLGRDTGQDQGMADSLFSQTTTARAGTRSGENWRQVILTRNPVESSGQRKIARRRDRWKLTDVTGEAHKKAQAVFDERVL